MLRIDIKVSSAKRSFRMTPETSGLFTCANSTAPRAPRKRHCSQLRTARRAYGPHTLGDRGRGGAPGTL